MKYRVIYDGEETNVVLAEDDDPDGMTLAQAKAKAVKHMRGLRFMLLLQLKHVKNLTADRVGE